MTSHDPTHPLDDDRNTSISAASSPSKDGLDKVELSDLDASPPQLPVENDLMQLARLGELRAIQKLFDSGKFNSRSTDDQGITALHWAAINGHYALCHFLLSSGADVNAKGGDAQATPVLWASKRFNLPVISLLLAHGADPLIRDDQGYNLLHSATLDGNVFQLILLLHQPDLPVDVPDAHGHTSLMWAAYKGFPACIDILLRFGADVHATDSMGFTALHWALVRGSYACIQKLVEHGSDRYMRSKPIEGNGEGDTPSMTASKMKSERQWRKALLDSGYDAAGEPVAFPLPFIKDKRWFFKCFFFLWPFALGGCQLHMLAYLPIWFAAPGVLILGYSLQFLVKKLLRWTPSDMKSIQRTPMLAGVFAGSLFWVGVRYVTVQLPSTIFSHPLLNVAFATAYGLCTYFYVMTMAMDPGFVPKGASRGQTKKTIDDLLDNNAFNETHFCTTCMIRKPLRSKHCRRCSRCVAREDHHCPWVDNCIGINNHKHFVLYVIWLIIGLVLLIQVTIRHLELLPKPTQLHCTFLNDAICAELSKDPLTLVITAWGCLQLTWTVMLLFVHMFQVAQNLTTYESMRNTTQVGPVLSALTTGTMSLDAAQVNDAHGHHHGHNHGHGHGHGHSHGHKAAKQESCFGRWAKLLGIDTFLAIAFQGYKGSQGGTVKRDRNNKRNPYSRGVVRNCQDFWLDGPLFRSKESGEALLGGERISYARIYEMPRRHDGSGHTEHSYEEVPGSEPARG